MKKKIALILAVIVILLVSFVFISNLENNAKTASLKVSENKVAFYPSERHMIILSSKNKIDESKLKFKSKDVKVQKVQCITNDKGDNQCALSFSGFEPTNEKVEIKYGGKQYYVNVKVKSLDDHKKNMSSDEKYQIALAKLLTKYKVVSTDDIKDEKLRSKVEKKIEKLKDKYTDSKDENE